MIRITTPLLLTLSFLLAGGCGPSESGAAPSDTNARPAAPSTPTTATTATTEDHAFTMSEAPQSTFAEAAQAEAATDTPALVIADTASPEDAVAATYDHFVALLRNGHVDAAAKLVLEPSEARRLRRLDSELDQIAQMMADGQLEIAPAGEVRIKGEWAIVATTMTLTEGPETHTREQFLVNEGKRWLIVPEGIRSDAEVRLRINDDFMELFDWYRATYTSPAVAPDAEPTTDATTEHDPELKQRELLDGVVTMLMPVAFIPMPEDMLRAKYPMSQRPTEVYTNPSGSVNVAFNLTSNELEPHQLLEAHAAMEAQFRVLYPTAEWFDSEVIEINGHDYMRLELTTPAVDTDIYNLILGTSYRGRMLLISFNSTIEEAERWHSVGEHIIDSIELHAGE